MSEQLLTILKLCLLVLLYLFFFRVLRAVWVEINGPKLAERRAPAPAAAPAPGPVVAAPTGKGRKPKRNTPTHLTVVEPAEQKGRTWPLGTELTVGRAAGCHIVLDDTYASQIHARVYVRDGQHMVEDLGSTNGTMVNRKKLAGPAVIRRGDRLQIGSTVMELA